jgi:purine-cytosine permease-like protein
LAIFLEEHFVFRKGRWSNYRVGGLFVSKLCIRGSRLRFAKESWDRQDLLPMGLAAIVAGCCGVAGAVLGMNQTWFQGPIAKLIGEDGGGTRLGCLGEKALAD